MQVLQLIVAVLAVHPRGFLKVQKDVPGHTEPTPPGTVEGPNVDETTEIMEEPVTPDTVESTVEHQIEDSLSPSVVMDCSAETCSERTISACRTLWTNKLKDCVDNYEKWSGFCSAPMYKDPDTGVMRDCKQGCCSPVAQGIEVVLEKANVAVEAESAEESEPEGEEKKKEPVPALTPEQTEDIVKQIAEKTNGGETQLTKEQIKEIAASVRAKAKKNEGI